jgi:hypothetical protein
MATASDGKVEGALSFAVAGNHHVSIVGGGRGGSEAQNIGFALASADCEAKGITGIAALFSYGIGLGVLMLPVRVPPPVLAMVKF